MHVYFDRPIGLSEMLMSIIMKPEFQALFERVPVILIPFPLERGHVAGRLITISSLSIGEGYLNDGTFRYAEDDGSVGSWSCYPGYYSHKVFGIHCSPREVFLLVQGRDSVDFDCSVTDADVDGYRDIIEPAGFGAWKSSSDAQKGLIDGITDKRIELTGSARHFNRGALQYLIDSVYAYHAPALLPRVYREEDTEGGIAIEMTEEPPF